MIDRPVALVTGGARGIGRGISLELAKSGFVVIAAATRPAEDERIAAFLDELNALDDQSIYVQADISCAEDRIRLVDAAYDHFGRLDVLVNNAGVAPLIRGDLLEMTEESLDRLLDINLKGTFFLSQYASRRMLECPTDAPQMLINITSISAETASVSRGEYCMSKAALAMSTKLFADRLAPHGINVYELRPGIVDTDMISAVKSKYDEKIAGGLLPIPRIGRPEDLGRAVVGLAKGYFAYTTGQVINVDGGFHISRL